MRSDTAFFSAADISRRFLAGLASGLLSVAAAAFVGEEERRDVKRAVGADAPRICSTSVQRLDLGLGGGRFRFGGWRLPCAISLMALESSDPAMGMSPVNGAAGHGTRRPRPPAARRRGTAAARGATWAKREGAGAERAWGGWSSQTSAPVAGESDSFS